MQAGLVLLSFNIQKGRGEYERTLTSTTNFFEVGGAVFVDLTVWVNPSKKGGNDNASK
jgi:hypothetical protein